jgi:molybdate transport system regulatory protein
MDPKPGNLSIKSKIWIEDENGGIVFGSGRLYILEAVARHGSINAAAQELHMSYRAVWGKIRATEKRLGHPLLYRKTGGTQGGGSELTPFGKKIIECFGELQSLTRNAADELFRDIFTPGLDDPKKLTTKHTKSTK